VADDLGLLRVLSRVGEPVPVGKRRPRLVGAQGPGHHRGVSGAVGDGMPIGSAPRWRGIGECAAAYSTCELG
jgi:hypothetical protein